MEYINGYPVLREVISIKVPTEEKAIALIDEFKKGQGAEGYIIGKSGYVLKTKKAKAEIIDSWYVVTCQKDYEVEA